MLTRLISVLALFLINQDAASSLTTYYQAIWVREYVTYDSLPIFEHTVQDGTSSIKWRFLAHQNSKDCTVLPVYVQMQYQGYPLFDKPETYPADFYLKRSLLTNFTVSTNATATVLAQPNPLAGKWFGVAYILQEEDTAVKKITDKDCTYTLQFNVTTKSPTSQSDQLAAGQAITARLEGRQNVSFTFPISHVTWKLEIRLWNCSVNNTMLPSCPVNVLARGGAQPTNKLDSHYLNCTSLKKCSLKIVGPNTDMLQYLRIENQAGDKLSFRLKVVLTECEHQYSEAAIPYLMDHLSSPQSQPSNDSSGMSEAIRKRRDTMTPLASRHYKDSDSCNPIPVLNRSEDSQNVFYVIYGVGGASPLLVQESKPEIRAFDVIPLKDTGGTIRFVAKLNPEHPEVFYNATVCITRGVVPLDDSEGHIKLSCPVEDMLTLTNSDPSEMTILRYFPYPESGRWFLGVDLSSNDTDSAKAEVFFSIMSSPCVDSQCENSAQCKDYYKGTFFFSFCDCDAGYRGYTCADDSGVKSRNLQLFYTLFLVLSNLGFIPGIILALKRRFFVEALVYFSNMFFSGFYHACDMRHWSVYTLCIMPYHVLSYCDFFCSILSFWVTLIALSELPPPVTHFFHIMGVIALAMGVEWQIHGIWPYVVPVVTGALLMITSWILKSVINKSFHPGKKRLLWMLPGLLMAAGALCVAGFVENDANYPYSHSAWHLAISLSIVFLLPAEGYYYHYKLKRNGYNGDSGLESDSSSSSEVLVLLPADSVNHHGIEFDDDDVPLNTDILLHSTLDDDEDEAPLRDLL